MGLMLLPKATDEVGVQPSISCGTTPPACDFGKIRIRVRASGRSEGDGDVEYLMVHRADGSAAFAGFEPVVGRVAGKVGTFVLQRVGTFEGGQAKKHIQSSRAPQRESFGGLRWEGTSAVGHGNEHPFVLNYDWE